MSECNDCHHTVNAPITECPKCKSKNISYWTRIIGYLTKVDNWSKARQIEQKQRTYTEEKDVKIS
jgi:ribonucleoside-triphosphate reductase